MPLISAVPQPQFDHVLITIDWSDTPTVLFARVIRIEADGTETVVRAHTFTDVSGEYIELSGGQAILYDTEAPLDVTLQYRTEGFGSVLTATDGEVILASANDLWLKDPLRPAGDQRVLLGSVDPECVPERGIYFARMEAQQYVSRSQRFVVNNRRNPAVSARVRAGVATVLVLVSRRFEDRDALLDLLEPGNALLLQVPPQYGIVDYYLDVGDVTVTRLSTDHRKQWREEQLPHVEVDRPAGLMFGTLGMRWIDVCDVYATFADATAAGLTWTQVMLGFASTVPIVNYYRTYAEVNAEFASYNAVNTGGRTYEDLLEGR